MRRDVSAGSAVTEARRPDAAADADDDGGDDAAHNQHQKYDADDDAGDIG